VKDAALDEAIAVRHDKATKSNVVPSGTDAVPLSVVMSVTLGCALAAVAGLPGHDRGRVDGQPRPFGTPIAFTESI
jgi:hypothetical protein